MKHRLMQLSSLQAPGIVAFISAKDIPGENKVKGGASDAPLFADEKVEYVGQHIGVVVAESPKQAQAAAALVAVRYGHPKVGKAYTQKF
jgi:xanthine dehydrogenase molybdopterin-binding subunit B